MQIYASFKAVNRGKSYVTFTPLYTYVVDHSACNVMHKKIVNDLLNTSIRFVDEGITESQFIQWNCPTLT